MIAEMDEVRVLDAMAKVLAVARGMGEPDEDEAKQLTAIRRISVGMAAWCEAEIVRILEQIAEHRLAVEPFGHPYNVFRLFGVERSETRWTQWVGNLWRRENGERCARITWRAFCDAVSDRISKLAPQYLSHSRCSTIGRQHAPPQSGSRTK
ncbi:MAG: hypothetical protein NT062_36870 [Proteobacteria bacterium]|nr:hypothetical protein [Pseudomonadota bacterium]